MKKNLSDNSPMAEATLDRGGAQGGFDPGAFADDNTQLVLYLNSLLASAAQTKLDFSEAGFNGDGTETFACGQGGAGEVLYFGAERAKSRVKELRNENNLLRMKVARLIAQLNEAECKLDSACAENASLKSDIDDLQDRIVLYKAAVIDASRRVPEDPAPPIVKESVLQVEPIQAVFDAEQVLVVVEPEIETLEVMPALEVFPCAAPEAADCEAAGEVAIDPEITLDQSFETAEDAEVQADVELPAPRGNICCVEAERVCQVPAVATDRMGTRVAEVVQDSRIFSNKVIAAGDSVQRIRAASRIIKREVKSQESGQEKGRGSNDAAPSSVWPPREAGPKSKPAFMPLVTAPEAQSAGTDAGKEMALATGIDQIIVKAAPDTKIVARKHIERYRLIQKEADSPEVATAPDLDGKA